MTKYKRREVIGTTYTGKELQFKNCAQAAEHFGCSKELVRTYCIKGKSMRNGTSFEYAPEAKVIPAIIVINKTTSESEDFRSYRSASLAIGRSEGYFSRAIRDGGFENAQYKWAIPNEDGHFKTPFEGLN